MINNFYSLDNLSFPVIVLIALGVINILAFLLVSIDKSRARRLATARISEGAMFFTAILGGGLGIYLGMFLFRHKTKKWYFVIGMPLVISQHISLLYLAYLYFTP